MADKRIKLLADIEQEVIKLKKSPLYAERIKNGTFPVIGGGSHRAKVMFVGEAPGRNEAKTGKPFIGSAGKILDQMFQSIGMERSEVYITSIVKDRPPLNRDPSPKEITIYGPFLDRQIEIIRPRVIATLGRFSMEYVIRLFGLGNQLKPISKMHGKSFGAKASYGPIKIITLYHPAVAIYNQSSKGILLEDFKILKQYI